MSGAGVSGGRECQGDECQGECQGDGVVDNTLIDKVYRLENQYTAYRSVRANSGALGIDGVTVKAYGLNPCKEINQLHHELKTGAYEPMPVLRMEIPKPDGSKRPLGIPAVKDRIVQQALLNILQPIFDPEFHPSSYGYRPKRTIGQNRWS